MAVRLNVPYTRVVPIASPAVGAEFTITAPGQGWWRVISLAFLLTTDANVANRTVRLLGGDGMTTYFTSASPATQAAGLARSYAAFEGSQDVATSANDTRLAFPTRGLWLLPGHTLRSVATNIQVGDQYSAIGVFVEEFPNGPHSEWNPTVDRAEYLG